MLFQTQKSVRLLAITSVALIAAACDSDGNGGGLGTGNPPPPPPPTMVTFDVTVNNLTNAQPL